ARRRAGARLGGRGDPRRPSLLSAADDAAGRGGDEPRVVLSLHRAGRDRPPGRRSAQGERSARVTSEFDQLYREVILDHYKNPRNHGVIEDADAHAEGQNPLCGDEVSIWVDFDGDTIR